jgi:signal transduction histidine kinase
LLHTPYAATDPSIQILGLRTYVGKAVSVGGTAVGSLCTLFKDDFNPGEDDRRLLGIIASAIGVEEVRRRAQAALRDSEEQLRYLSSELLNTQEVEKKRLAAKLHDAVGQSLSALKFSIEESLDVLGGDVDEEKIKPLRNAVPLIKEVVNEIRGIQRDLRPPMLDDLGILATVKSFAKRFMDVYQSIRLETHIAVQEDEFPKPLKVVIYRIIQEAMNNVARHSKAESAHIELSKTADALQLVIWDDGQGFDAEQAFTAHFRKGLGLSSMKERAELSGGAFRIEAHRGEGTKIKVSWPLEAKVFTGPTNLS